MSRGASLSRMDIQTVVKDAVTARTRPLPVDAGGVYLVLTSPEVRVENFCGQVCGFHYFTFPSVVGYTLPYAWVGNSAGRCPEVCAYPFAIPAYVPGRRPEAPPNGDPGVVSLRVLHESQGKRSVVSHFNKATKGRLVRSLLEDGSTVTSPARFAEQLRDLGWVVEADGTRLDVVVTDL